MAGRTEQAFLSKPKRWGSGETERSVVFRGLSDARNEVRLVCLRFLQEVQHPVLDRRFPRKFGKPSSRVRSRSRVVPFAFTAGRSVPPKRVSRDPFPVLSAIPRSSLDAPGSGAGYVDHPDEPGRASLSGRCIRGNEVRSSFQPFGWSVRISLLDATQPGVSTTYQEGGYRPPFRGVTSAITVAIRLAGCGAIPCCVGHILLIAGALVCIVLVLIKVVFDREEARDKREKDDQ
jgi:hypothetical protein